MIVPAMIRVPPEVSKEEQELMAELIALHLWFARRLGQVSMLGNPGIEIDDQVRIFERVTAETYIHYVRAISSAMDVESGVYTMTLTTSWLGSEDDTWAITANNVPVDGSFSVVPGVDNPERFEMSDLLAGYVDSIRSEYTPVQDGQVVAFDTSVTVAEEGSGPSG